MENKSSKVDEYIASLEYSKDSTVVSDIREAVAIATNELETRNEYKNDTIVNLVREIEKLKSKEAFNELLIAGFREEIKKKDELMKEAYLQGFEDGADLWNPEWEKWAKENNIKLE